MKHNQTSSLKAKNSPVNKEEWELILSSVLLGATEEGHADITRGVEAVAKVDSNVSSIAITIQKRIEGITVCSTSCLITVIILWADFILAKTRHYYSPSK